MPKRLLDQRWPWLVAAGAIILAFLATFVEIGPPDADPRPSGSAADIAALRNRTDVNVLFILVDMLRADRMTSYGYQRETSPQLDALAARGVRFARHLSQSSWTKTSMASLWSGLNPARAGILRFDEVIPDSAVLPAEILAQAGFQTVGIYRNGWVAPTFGFGQGFEVYKHPPVTAMPPDVKLANPTLTDQGTDEGAVEAALEFLRINGNRRWFLYMHLMDVHEYLYDEESALFGTSHSDIYDNSVRHTDAVLGVLLESLAAFGHADNTLVVVSSDHGEAFGERGFEGHAREVFRETTEVPFLLSFPFQLEPGLVVETRTRNVDVWPTILDLIGLAMPDTDGRSLVPEIVALARGEQPATSSELAVSHLDQTWGRPEKEPLPAVAVVDDGHRYVRMVQPNSTTVEALFDRKSDPQELDDRAADDPQTLARLRGEADRYLEAKPAWGEIPTRELDRIELNHLRALGYAIP